MERLVNGEDYVDVQMVVLTKSLMCGTIVRVLHAIMVK